MAADPVRTLELGAVPANENYQVAADQDRSCATCSYYSPHMCHLFSAPVDAQGTCDSWAQIRKADLDAWLDPEQVEALAAVDTDNLLPSGPTRSQESAEAIIDNPDAQGAVIPDTNAVDVPWNLNLQVVGVSKTGGQYVYRMGTRDGHYVGRTNPTKVRALKGDVLRVQPNIFKQSAHGDFEWLNPNVVGRVQERAHARKELSTASGAPMPASRDFGGAAMSPARIAATPMEAAADAGGAGSTQPGLNSVHVNAPLKSLSVAYTTNKKRRVRKLQVVKAQTDKQLLYGIVLEPHVVDSQADWVPADHVEIAAHRFLAKTAMGRASVHRIQHRASGFNAQNPKIVPVESFIAPMDFTYDGREMVKKGSWVLVGHVRDANLWQDVLDGKYTGWSVGGTGQRRSLTETVVNKAEAAPMWHFAIDANTGGLSIWPSSEPGPVSKSGLTVEGNLYRDGGIYIPPETPAGWSEPLRNTVVKQHLGTLEAWVRSATGQEPVLCPERYTDPMPVVVKEAVGEGPVVTREDLDAIEKARDRMAWRQLGTAVAKLAERDPVINVHVDAPEIPPAYVTVENVLPADKPRKVRAVTKEDGTREFEIV